MPTKSIAFLVIVLVVFFAAGCTNNQTADSHTTRPIYTTDDYVDFGNGVYRFSVVRDEFGTALSKFIATNPDLQIVAITGPSLGSSWGYWVICQPINTADVPNRIPDD